MALCSHSRCSNSLYHKDFWPTFISTSLHDTALKKLSYVWSGTSSLAGHNEWRFIHPIPPSSAYIRPNLSSTLFLTVPTVPVPLTDPEWDHARTGKANYEQDFYPFQGWGLSAYQFSPTNNCFFLLLSLPVLSFSATVHLSAFFLISVPMPRKSWDIST